MKKEDYVSLEVAKPGMATRDRSLLQEHVKKITFNNGVTMKFIPWYDPTTGKTY